MRVNCAKLKGTSFGRAFLFPFIHNVNNIFLAAPSALHINYKTAPGQCGRSSPTQPTPVSYMERKDLVTQPKLSTETCRQVSFSWHRIITSLRGACPSSPSRTRQRTRWKARRNECKV